MSTFLGVVLGCSPGKKNLKFLTAEDASDGSIHLQQAYSSALRKKDLAAFADLYHDLPAQGVGTAGNIVKWQLPARKEQNGVVLYHYENQILNGPNVHSFLKRYNSEFREIIRAQIWFSDFEKKAKNRQELKVWVEITGTSMKEELVSHKGYWQWHISRTSPSHNWKIDRHVLLDWDETTRKKPLFKEVARTKGISFKHSAATTDLNLFIPENHGGSGVALADFDLDGDLDVYFGNGEANRLYRNEGNGHFVDISQKSAVNYAGITRGVLFTDLTEDGLPDILLANAHDSNRFFRNLGNGTFEDFTQKSNLASDSLSTSISAADIDLDGDLDLIFTCYRLSETLWPNRKADNGCRNLLYINDGAGLFHEESENRGLTETAWSLAAAFADYDDDGDPDLIVANDFGPDHFYVNNGRGYFAEQSVASGIKDRGFSMSTSWGDFDNDGDLDLYLSKMTSGSSWMFADPRFPMSGMQAFFRKFVVRELKEATYGNSLFENLGDGTFKDISHAKRVAMAHWSWGSTFFDFDNDGDLDIYATNGFWSGADESDT